MLSRQIETSNPLSLRWLLGVASALLAFGCLLAAFFMVVSHQVEQAGSREAGYRQSQAGVSACVANVAGPARSQCIAAASALPGTGGTGGVGEQRVAGGGDALQADRPVPADNRTGYLAVSLAR